MEQNLVPFHPLFFTQGKPIQQAASLVLRVFVEESNCQRVKAFKSRLPDKPNNLAHQLLNGYIDRLSKQKEFSAEEFDRKELKKDMLNIYEKILAGAIREANNNLKAKAIKLAKRN